jgi:predicted MPP superfamily phosphohydrolase
MAQRFWLRAAERQIQKLNSRRWQRFFRVSMVIAASWLVLVLADRLIGHFLPHRGPVVWMITAAQLWLLPSLLAYLLIKIVHTIEWLWARFAPKPFQAQTDDVDLSRRGFFRYAAGLAGAVPLVAAVYGFARERFQYTVHRVDVPVANLPSALEGLQIVQLSDIHIGDFMPREEVRRAVDMANELGAHVAMVTGDFVSEKGDPLEVCIAELSRLKTPLGTWGCNGNHEIYAEAEDDAQELFRKYRMRLLRHENALLHWNWHQINLIGVDYQRQRLPMLMNVESLVRGDVPNILLSHNPNSFRRAAELGIELSLAGHTHGGQVKMEIVDHAITPARFMTNFIAGRYALPMNGSTSHAQLYVNRGLGTIGVPARLGVEPEITLLTLRRA